VQITDGLVRVTAEISWSALTPGGLPPGGRAYSTLKERTGRWEIVQVILPRTDSPRAIR